MIQSDGTRTVSTPAPDTEVLRITAPTATWRRFINFMQWSDGGPIEDDARALWDEIEASC